MSDDQTTMSELRRLVAAFVVERARHLKFRMAFLVHPLVEKPVEIAAGRIFKCGLEILRNHIAAAMAPSLPDRWW